MNENYIQEGKYIFLRLEAEREADSGFEARMITNNQPELLLKMLVTRVGGQSFFDYNITGLCALSSVEKEAATYLFSVVSGLERLGEVLPKYLLSIDAVSLEPEHIFVRKETGQVYFGYLPGRDGTFPESVRKLMEFFMMHSAPTDPEEVLLLYGLYQKSREETVRPDSLAAYWREQKAAKPKKQELPVMEEPVVEFPDEDIYAEIGMERPKKEKHVFQRRGNQRGGGDSEAYCYGYGDPSPREQRGRSAGKGRMNDRNESGSERSSKEIEKEELKAAGSLKEKAQIIWKNHKGEIAVGAVVVVGAVLILIR